MSRPSSTEDGFVDLVLEAAERHGRGSDPDMEIGDLQVFIRQCWNAMDADRRRSVAEHWTTEELLEEWNPLEAPPP